MSPQILVVDNQPGLFAPWIRALKLAYGEANVLVAAGVREALQTAEGLPPGALRLFVLDVMMPAEPPLSPSTTADGVRTGPALRAIFAKNPKFSNVPAIFLTNRADDDLVRSLRVGRDFAARKRDVGPQELVAEALRLAPPAALGA